MNSKLNLTGRGSQRFHRFEIETDVGVIDVSDDRVTFPYDPSTITFEEWADLRDTLDKAIELWKEIA